MPWSVAYPDARLGEKACAIVVPEPGEQPALEDITRFLRGRGISLQKLPEKLLLVDDLPMTATGKIQKFRLRKMARGICFQRAVGKNSAAAEVRPIMTTLADRTITAMRATHDDLAALVSDLSEDQLRRSSGATDWTVAQVLSHLGSGAEIALAVLEATIAGTTAPGQDFNHQVWDRWNAMKPQDQAAGYVEHDTRLITTYEALTPAQRETVQIDLGFLPAPLPIAAVAGMRLNETAQHSWDVRIALDPDATIPGDTAQLMAEHLAGDLRFMTGFIAKADVLATPAVVDIADSGFGIVIADSVSLTEAVPAPTATFVGSLEAAIRLIGGRLTVAHTPAAVEVTGNLTLDDLRKVFPGY